MSVRTLCLGLLLFVSTSCARPPDTHDFSRFSAVAMTLHPDAALTRLERQQVVSDLRIALAQRNAFGRVLSVPPTGKPTGVMLVDLRLLDIKRLMSRIDLTAQVDLVDMATRERVHSFSLGVSGSRDGDLGTLSIGVISDLVEQIADVLARRTLL